MTRGWTCAVLLVTGILAGCSAADEDAAAPAPVALVKLAPASRGGGARAITLYGAAEPGAAGKLALVAPAEATVLSIAAPAGTRVAPGQIVVRLAASPTTRAEATKAASDAAAADTALARAQRLRADGLVSDAEVETARAAAASADALRASFATRASALTLRAPAAGVVESIAVTPGDLLQAGAAIGVIARVGDVRVRFGIDPDAARSVSPGSALTIAGVAARAPLVVRIDAVSPVIDPQTRLAALFARVPGGSGIVAGETLSATIDTGGNGAALSIPYAALLDDGGQAYVYVVTNGVAHRRDLVVAPSSGDRATVTRGLNAGEQVVTAGGTALEDGMKVRTR